MSPLNERAIGAASTLAWAVVLAIVLIAIAKFALLPAQQSFTGLTLILALFLVPLGALSIVPRLASYLSLTIVVFCSLWSITNVISYNVLAFYNSALPVLLGGCASIVALYIIPPIPLRVRVANLLAATLAELWRYLTRPQPASRTTWEARMYRRLAAMPAGAEPVEGGRLVAALTVGCRVLQLRRLAAGTRMSGDLQGCFHDVARGLLSHAFSGFAAIDRMLAVSPLPAGAAATMQARAALQGLVEALDAHPVYFGRLGEIR